MTSAEVYVVPHNGKLLSFLCDGRKLYCKTYEFDKTRCRFCQTAQCDSSLISGSSSSSKDIKASLLSCDVVTDGDSFMQVPCALLSCQSKSKETFKLFVHVSGLELCLSWKHQWEGSENSANMNVRLGDGPCVLIPNGKYLMFHGRKRASKGFESVKLSKYFNKLSSFDIVATRVTAHNLLIVLILITLSNPGQVSNDCSYGVFTIDNADALVLKTCDITSCIPPIYFPMICDVFCKRLTLRQDEDGNNAFRSEMYAVTSANQIVRFEDGRLKNCGAVETSTDANLCQVKIFETSDQSYGCVTSKDGKCFVVNLETFEIEDQAAVISNVYIGDFLGTGAQQAILAEGTEPEKWKSSVLTDGATWRFILNKQLSTEQIRESVITETDTNSKTAMKALSNRIMSGRGHMLEMKREMVLREQIIKNISAQIVATCSRGSSQKPAAIQDDLLNPFGEDEVMPCPGEKDLERDGPLEISETWVRQQHGEVIFCAAVANLSGRDLEGLQLMVTMENDHTGMSSKSQSKLILMMAEEDELQPNTYAKKKKKDSKYFMGIQDVSIVTKLKPGHSGYVVCAVQRSVLNRAVCKFDANLTWHEADGTVCFCEVPAFEVKVSDLLKGLLDGRISQCTSDEGCHQQLIELVSFFATSSLVDLVITSTYSRISNFDAVLVEGPLTFNEKLNFWYDSSGAFHFPSVSVISVKHDEVIIKVSFRDSSQLTFLLVHLYDALPCDINIQPCCHGSLSFHQTQLLKYLHQEAGAMKTLLSNEKKETTAEDSPFIDFSTNVEAVRQQVESRKQRLLHKRKAPDEQAVEVLSQTITGLQLQTDSAAEQLILKCNSS